MKNFNSTLLSGVLIIVLIAAGWFLLQSRLSNQQQSQRLLAQEINQVLGIMMADLSAAQLSTIKGVPADGLWHHTITFEKKGEGVVGYTTNEHQLSRHSSGLSQVVARNIQALDMRRIPSDASMLQVKVLARNQSSLTTNFNIRLRE